MEVSYKRQFGQSYMIIKEEENSGDIFEIMVLAYNKISKLLPMETSITDGEACFWYDITGRQSLTDYLCHKQVDSKLLLLLFQSIENVYQKAKEYLLEENGIVLEGEYIYLDFEQRNIEFIYLPGRDRDPRFCFQEIMEMLLRKLDHGDKRGTAIAYEMYQLSLQRERSFLDMLKQAMEMEAELEAESHTCFSIKQEHMELEEQEKESENQKNLWNEKIFSENEKPAFRWLKKHKWNRNERQEDLPYVTQDDEIKGYPTELLNDPNKAKGILMYQGVGLLPDIKIDKEIFLIGKKQREVDGFIDRKSVSRIHARIEVYEDMYYIEDLNSTNGTYLNGERLEYRQKVRLETKDRVTFGAEEYIFM